MFEGGGDLVFEFLAVDTGAAPSGAGGIASLEHEGGDYAVEEERVVVTPLDERGEVGASLGEGVSEVFGKKGGRRGRATFGACSWYSSTYMTPLR